MYYEEIFRQLNEANADYLVAGGMAVNLHGVPRLTQDLDLLPDLSEGNLLKIVKILDELGYRPRIPEKPSLFADAAVRERWKNEKNMKVFSFFHRELPYQEIDLMFDVPVSFEEAVQNKIVKRAADLVIPLVSIPDLIRLKEAAGRKQDMSDIRMLREILKLERDDEQTSQG
jgi:hypothetical protein